MHQRPHTKRASTPRSSSGCGTCRSAHVKCDEQKPVCSRCMRLRLSCTGWPLKSKILTGSSSAVGRLGITFYELPFAVPGGPTDRKALHYYFTHGSASLSGFGNAADPFWGVFLPQRCSQEPVVRHALVALSCAHLEYYSIGDAHASHLSGKLVYQFSSATLHAQGRAIKTLKNYVGRDSISPTVVLLCCFLLNTFSRLQNDEEAALAHYDNGMKLLQGWQQSCCKENLSDVLVAKFGSIAIAANLRGDRAGGPTELMNKPDAHLMDDELVESFADLNEMHASLRTVAVGHLTMFLPQWTRYEKSSLEDIPTEILEVRERIQLAMDAWKLAVDKYGRDHRAVLNRPDNSGRQQAIGYQLALAYYWAGTRQMQRSLLSPAPTSESICTPWDDNPEELFEIAETISQLHKDMRASNGIKVQRLWCSEWGSTGALVMLAEKTTRPEIRSRALKLVGDF